MLLFLIPFFFVETVKAEEGDQVGPQAQESLHDSSTDSCPTLPYGFDSPRPSPPSPVPLVTISPERVSLLPIATSNSSSDNSAIQNIVTHDLPIPILSQSFTSALSTSTSNPYNTSPHFPFSYNSFPQVSPIIFPGIPTDYSHFRATLSGLNSTFPNAASPPPYPSRFQFTSGPRPSWGRGILTLEGEELLEAEDIESLPPPAVRPHPSPTTFGLIINPDQLHLEMLLPTML